MYPGNTMPPRSSSRVQAGLKNKSAPAKLAPKGPKRQKKEPVSVPRDPSLVTAGADAAAVAAAEADFAAAAEAERAAAAATTAAKAKSAAAQKTVLELKARMTAAGGPSAQLGASSTSALPQGSATSQDKSKTTSPTDTAVAALATAEQERKIEQARVDAAALAARDAVEQAELAEALKEIAAELAREEGANQFLSDWRSEVDDPEDERKCDFLDGLLDPEGASAGAGPAKKHPPAQSKAPAASTMLDRGMLTTVLRMAVTGLHQSEAMWLNRQGMDSSTPSIFRKASAVPGFLKPPAGYTTLQSYAPWQAHSVGTPTLLQALESTAFTTEERRLVAHLYFLAGDVRTLAAEQQALLIARVKASHVERHMEGRSIWVPQDWKFCPVSSTYGPPGSGHKLNRLPTLEQVSNHSGARHLAGIGLAPVLQVGASAAAAPPPPRAFHQHEGPLQHLVTMALNGLHRQAAMLANAQTLQSPGAGLLRPLMAEHPLLHAPVGYTNLHSYRPLSSHRIGATLVRSLPTSLSAAAARLIAVLYMELDDVSKGASAQDVDIAARTSSTHTALLSGGVTVYVPNGWEWAAGANAFVPPAELPNSGLLDVEDLFQTGALHKAKDSPAESGEAQLQNNSQQQHVGSRQQHLPDGRTGGPSKVPPPESNAAGTGNGKSSGDHAAWPLIAGERVPPSEFESILRYTNRGAAPATRPPPLANRELYFIYSIANNACANLGLYRTISAAAISQLAVETYWTNAGGNAAHADRDVRDVAYPKTGHQEWYECWCNYQSKVLQHGGIAAREQWIHYPNFISSLHATYAWEDVANFDVALRMMLERETKSPLNPKGAGAPVQFSEESPTVLAQLVAFTRKARPRTLNSGGMAAAKPQPRYQAPYTPPPDAGGGKPAAIGNYCARFNVVDGCKKDKCRYPHVCSACGGAHSYASCVDQRRSAGNPAIAFLAARPRGTGGGAPPARPVKKQAKAEPGATPAAA